MQIFYLAVRSNSPVSFKFPDSPFRAIWFLTSWWHVFMYNTNCFWWIIPKPRSYLTPCPNLASILSDSKHHCSFFARFLYIILLKECSFLFLQGKIEAWSTLHVQEHAERVSCHTSVTFSGRCHSRQWAQVRHTRSLAAGPTRWRVYRSAMSSTWISQWYHQGE